MVHLNITFPEDLKEQLDFEAHREHLKRSSLIQKAVSTYLESKNKKATETLLKKGYEEMDQESRLIMKDFQKLDRESLKYVD